MINLLTATLICVGMDPGSSPAVEIELEVKPSEKISTIRYEIVEGSLTGTAYVQSVGHLYRSKRGNTYTYTSGDGPNATVLVVQSHHGKLTSELSHYITDMKNDPVECTAEEDSDDGGHGGGH